MSKTSAAILPRNFYICTFGLYHNYVEHIHKNILENYTAYLDSVKIVQANIVVLVVAIRENQMKEIMKIFA